MRYFFHGIQLLEWLMITIILEGQMPRFIFKSQGHEPLGENEQA